MPLADLFLEIEKPEVTKVTNLVVASNPILDTTAIRNFVFTTKKPPPTLNKIYRVHEVLRLCPREEVIRYLKKIPIVEQYDIQTLYNFAVGNALHDMLREQILGPMQVLEGHWECRVCRHTTKIGLMPQVCQKCKVEGYDNFKFVEPRYEHGFVACHPDGILFYEGVRRLIEFKTISDRGFAKLLKPSAEHERQVQMYMELSGFSECVVVYIRKGVLVADGVLQFKVYVVKKNSFVVMPLLRRVEETKAAMRARKPPLIDGCTTQRSCKFGECRTEGF